MSIHKPLETQSPGLAHLPEDRSAPVETPGQRGSFLHRRWPVLLALALALALAHGILYATIIPPWQHYDEPTHFEYVRLIAERHRLPREGEYDLAMRQEIAASMRASGFWRDKVALPASSGPDQPPYIGISELGHPPLYYLLQALLQPVVASRSVETQLYLARLVSVLLFVVAVAAAYSFVEEAFPRRRWLPVAVATFIVLLPPFVDLMSAVNNDVGAIAFSTLYLWAAMRLVQRGPSLGRVVVTLVLAGVCIATKDTAGLVVAVVLPILAVATLPERYRPRVWASLGLLVLAALVLSVRWHTQAASWYSDDRPGAASRVRTATPLGDWAFLLAADRQDLPRVLFQEMPRAAGQDLRGGTVTVGAWLKVTEGEGSHAALSLDDGIALDWHRIEATSEWHFYAFTSTIATDAPAVALSALVPHQEAAREIYMDGLVLVAGEMPLILPPQFDTERATSGQWGGQSFTNLIRNGSAERSWPSLRPSIAVLRVFGSPANLVLQSLWDWTRTGWVYRAGALILFQSFWGRFGWNQVVLPQAIFYPLALISATALFGVGLGLVRRIRAGIYRNATRRQIWAILVTVVIASWWAALLRIHPIFITRFISWPVARYALVSVAPMVTLLCLGLAEVVPGRWQKKSAWIGLLGLIALDVIALWIVIFPYYYG